MRVITYARVSSDLRLEEGKSIPAQQNEMRQFVQQRGWTIVAEFADPGMTGTNMDRPGLQAVLAAVQLKSFDVLLVHELSRLSRSIFDTFEIFDIIGQFNIGFASVKDPDFDFSSPTGRLFLTILAALHQYYVDLVRMHTKKAKHERAREGLYNASTTPFGYRHTGSPDTPPEIVPDQAEAVRQIFARYVTGQVSYAELADWINDAGFRNRSGARFSKDTLADMLRNPFYKGYVLYRPDSRSQQDGELYPGRHQPIVDAETWDMARRIREQRRTAPRTYQPKYRVYLLNGIASCDICRRKLRAQGANNGNYYREMSRDRGFVDCPAASKGIRTDIIEQQVGQIFRTLRLPADWLTRLEHLLEQSGSQDRQTLDNRRARLIAERKRIKKMKIDGDFDDDQDLYRQELARIERDLAELPAPDDLQAIQYAAATLEQINQTWDQASDVDRRDLLRIVLKQVLVDVDQGRLAALEPAPVFIPLFRQIPLLRETDFGVFVPLWPPQQATTAGWGSHMPPILQTPHPATGPAWPFLFSLPDDYTGKRITPALSQWLKTQRSSSQDPEPHSPGPVVDLTQPNTPPLLADERKWPGVQVSRVPSLDHAPSPAAFLWTPFAFQSCPDKAALIEQVCRIVRPGGTWAFVDLLPAAMPGHWLYRFFPAAWAHASHHTWDAFQVFNRLSAAGLQVELTRRSIHQPIRLGTALDIARQRAECPPLQYLPDATYEDGIARMEEMARRESAETLVGSEVCLMQVSARRQDKQDKQATPPPD